MKYKHFTYILMGVFSIIQFAGCSHRLTKDKNLLHNLQTYISSNDFTNLNNKISSDLKEDTTHYFLISISRYESTCYPPPWLNWFETQYLFVYIEEPVIYTDGEHHYDFYWKVYKFTNYSDKKYLGKVSGGAYNLIVNKLYDILNNRPEANIRDKLGYGLEFSTWINYNGRKITNNIINGGDMENTYVNLFTLVKSAVYELELEQYYQGLEN